MLGLKKELVDQECTGDTSNTTLRGRRDQEWHAAGLKAWGSSVPHLSGAGGAQH